MRLMTTLLLLLGLVSGYTALAQSASAHDEVNAVLEKVRSHKFHPADGGFTKDRYLGDDGVASLDAEDWRVRLEAIRDLVRIGEEAVPALREALSDENPEVGQVATYVLGLLGGGEVVDDLMERLREDSHPIVRSDAAIALGRIGDKKALPLLKDLKENEDQRDVRHQAGLAAYRVENGLGEQAPARQAYENLDLDVYGQAEVGKPAPPFSLRDTDGNEWKLADYLGEKPVVLIWIFADWCPVCHNEFHDLIRLEEEYKEAGIEVVTLEMHDRFRCRVMVGDEVQPQYWFARAPQRRYPEGLWWRHLVDLAGQVGVQYGVQPMAFAVHAEYINRPATVVIDKEGIVRMAYYGTYWGDRPSIEETLDIVVNEDYDYAHPERLKPAAGEQP